LEYLVQATHEERYRPAPLLRRMAQAGKTGRGAGAGFFEYREAQSSVKAGSNQTRIED
jgi:3-hydroxyacyl-CoA dehydrogenase